MTRWQTTTGEYARRARRPADPTAAFSCGRRFGSALCTALVLISLGCAAADVGEPTPAPEGAAAGPVKLTRAQIAGRVFEDFDALVEAHERDGQSWTTEDVEAFVSSDRKFDAGIYRSGPVRAEIDEPYGVDEFMYFIEGGVTLTSTDGTELVVEAGDAVMIPRQWRGVWDTAGYLKIYVIHYQTPLE
jgi:uncharacterized cupin superfamily protein